MKVPLLLQPFKTTLSDLFDFCATTVLHHSKTGDRYSFMIRFFYFRACFETND